MKKALLGLIGAGGLLLVLSQFLPLFHTHVSSMRASVGSLSVGSSHAFLVLPLAVLAMILGWGVIVTGSRFALGLVGVVGVGVLVVALGHDLSRARASGLKVLAVNDYATVHNVVAIGLYVEIAGALVLLMATVLGLLLAGPQLHEVARAQPARARRASSRARPRRRSRSETIGRHYDDQ